jgi:glycosyltransferase involved in cell wall biosynthesis
MIQFSIVIPAFNRESLIAATLDSILAQERRDVEVIVVDDGSTDGTRDVVQSYGDRVRLLTQSNRGPGAARNLGIREAAGRYVGLFDSDDLHFPWTLATYARVIRDHAEPAFVTGWPVEFRDAGELASVRPSSDLIESFADYFSASDAWRWFSASSFVVRRDVLQSVGCCTEARIAADDCDLAMRLGTATGFVHVRSPATFAYREHAGSLKSDHDLQCRSLRYLIEQEAAGRYPGGPARRRERIEILARHVRPFVLGALRAGRPRLAWKLYADTWAWHLHLRRWKYLLGTPCVALANVRTAIGIAKGRSCSFPG